MNINKDELFNQHSIQKKECNENSFVYASAVLTASGNIEFNFNFCIKNFLICIIRSLPLVCNIGFSKGARIVLQELFLLVRLYGYNFRLISSGDYIIWINAYHGRRHYTCVCVCVKERERER